MKPSEMFKRKTNKTGLYNIMPLNNVPSVLQYGILSYHQAERIIHQSVAMPDIQSRRDDVTIPNGLKLHEYANLYFDARNPMLYKRRDEEICVLKICPEILDIPDVIIADQNASSSYVRFYEPDSAFENLRFDMIYAQYWTDDNPFLGFEKKSVKCAEVLVPQKISPQYIIAAAVKNPEDKEKLLAMDFKEKIYIEPKLFFR